jgi:DNA-binding response OmpR family regulator
MKILVADDDLDQLTMRCLLLERSGFETLQATDATSALALAETEKPECAVVDLNFPNEESGFRLVRDLKALDAAIRLVLLTGARPGVVAGRSEAPLIEKVVEKGLGSANLVRTLKALESAHS